MVIDAGLINGLAGGEHLTITIALQLTSFFAGSVIPIVNTAPANRILLAFVLTTIGPQDAFEVTKLPIEILSSYKVTTVLATAIPLNVPETDVAVSETFAGNVPHLEADVRAAVA